MLDDEIKTLAQGKNFGALSTFLPSGQIRSHVVWVDCDDDHILVNPEPGLRKFKNARPPFSKANDRLRCCGFHNGVTLVRRWSAVSSTVNSRSPPVLLLEPWLNRSNVSVSRTEWS
jgi:hypothetical protein